MSVPASIPDQDFNPGPFEYTGPAFIPGTATPFPFAASNLPTCTGLKGQGCSFPSNMLSRNSFVGPGNWNLNFGIYKDFKLTERVNVQFRGEFFDLTNHKNFYILGFGQGGADVSVYNTCSAGGTQPCTANAPFAQAKKGGYGSNEFDDHRNVQLALKVIF